MEPLVDYRAAAEAFLEALGRRDWEGLGALFTEDVVWTLPGDSKISGRAEGIVAVVQRARTITSYGLTFTLKHILLGQSGMALSLNNTARRGDLVLDEHLATVCGFREGKISNIDSFLSDVPMADAFSYSWALPEWLQRPCRGHFSLMGSPIECQTFGKRQGAKFRIR